MLRALAPAAADDRPYRGGHRHVRLAGSEPPLGRRVHQVLHREHEEVTAGVDEDGLHALERHADTGPSKHVLAERGFDEPVAMVHEGRAEDADWVGDAYTEAWTEWAEIGEADLWESTSSDGLPGS